MGAWSDLTDTELEWLARGQLHLRVYGKTPGQELRGQVVIATTCSGKSHNRSSITKPACWLFLLFTS